MVFISFQYTDVGPGLSKKIMVDNSQSTGFKSEMNFSMHFSPILILLLLLYTATYLQYFKLSDRRQFEVLRHNGPLKWVQVVISFYQETLLLADFFWVVLHHARTMMPATP